MYSLTSEVAENLVPSGTMPRESKNRQRSYDDFIAVAENLIALKATGTRQSI